MINVFNTLADLVKKLFPDGNKKIEALQTIELARAAARQPLALSIIAILQLLIFQGKSIAYRLMKIVYFNTPEWWTDVVIMLAIISFLFGVPFEKLLKPITWLRGKLKRKK